MEVHHHPHPGKKSFKEYFLEFLMIFLAVTMGFFAESIREHVNDRAKETEFMRSMIEDLKADTASAETAANTFTRISHLLDTLLICLKNDVPDPAIINRKIAGNFWAYTGYSYNNRTIQQLKNAGNFRLIRNSAVADSILKYDNFINSIMLTQYVDLKNTMYAYKDVEAKVVRYSKLNTIYIRYALSNFDSSVFRQNSQSSFISRDKELLSMYYNRLFIHEALTHTFIANLKHNVAYAADLIRLIRKEYHLEDE